MAMQPNSGEVDPTESQGADQVTKPQGADLSGDQVTQGLMAVSQALDSFEANLGKSLPPEAMQALQAAGDAYDQFLAAVGIKDPDEGQENPGDKAAAAPMGQQSAMSAGRGNAVPADMPSRKGMQPA